MTLQSLANSPWWAALQFAPQLMTALVLGVLVVWVSRLQFRVAESEQRLRHQSAVTRNLWESLSKRRATPDRDSELMATRFESQPWWGGLNG